jgi:hypothetical protein
MSDGEENTNTDSEQPPKRPNANYRLSNENRVEERLNFRYNREHRLEKAPQSVRTLYREQKPQRFGLFHSLIGSKPRAMMFGSIIFLSIVILILSNVGYLGDTWELDGNRFTIQAIKFEGTVIIALKKNNQKKIPGRNKTPYTGAVNIAVSPAIKSGSPQMSPQAEEKIFYHRIFFTLENKEDYRFVVPFDSDELVIVLQTEKMTRTLTLKPE